MSKNMYNPEVKVQMGRVERMLMKQIDETENYLRRIEKRHRKFDGRESFNYDDRDVYTEKDVYWMLKDA